MKKLLDVLVHIVLPIETIALVAAAFLVAMKLQPELRWLTVAVFCLLAILHGYVTWQLYTRKEE